MTVTWILLLALGVVAADVSHLGYHYNVPHTSYGVPSYEHVRNTAQFATTVSNHQPNTIPIQTTGISTSATGNSQYSQINNNDQTRIRTQYEASLQYQAALKKYQNYFPVQNQPAQVFKHFYVHSAPEEQEEVKPRAPIVLPPPQKHYKIIFVKAPSEPRPPQVIAPIQPQNEEKTIVYVLVKKPDEQPDIVLPKIEQAPPSKPEVYFIKYKNKDDSQAVINNIVQDYNKGGQSVSVNLGGTEGSSSFSSNHGSVQYQPAPVQNGGLINQSFGSSTVSVNSGLGTPNIASPIASPVSISSTAVSSASFENGAISTSQGVPHESYGPPKFRLSTK